MSVLYYYLQELKSEIPDRTEQFDRLKVLSGRHMTSETPEVVQFREEFERCEKLWNSLTTGLQSLPAAMEPWKKVTSKNQELGDWFDDLEERASRDLEALGEVHDDTADVCDHIYRLKVLILMLV